MIRDEKNTQRHDEPDGPDFPTSLTAMNFKCGQSVRKDIQLPLPSNTDAENSKKVTTGP